MHAPIKKISEWCILRRGKGANHKTDVSSKYCKNRGGGIGKLTAMVHKNRNLKKVHAWAWGLYAKIGGSVRGMQGQKRGGVSRTQKHLLGGTPRGGGKKGEKS